MYGSTADYVIPNYRTTEDVSWYHALHGDIPKHQIDFIYRPEVPQGALTPTHLSHLTRLLGYIEPHADATHAFAIGNLSRDDTQHQVGHGAVGLIFGFRMDGMTDHVGRESPPFAHGIIAVDRQLSCAVLLDATLAFHRHLTIAGEGSSSARAFYQEYKHTVLGGSQRAIDVVKRYVDEFTELPQPPRSSLPWSWIADEDTPQQRRVVIVHKDDAPFDAIASAAARLTAILYCSNIKWTSVSNGREKDIPGGISIRFASGRSLTPADQRGVIRRLEDLADDDGEVARDMFGARPYGKEKPRHAGWRERYAATRTPEGARSSGGRSTSQNATGAAASDAPEDAARGPLGSPVPPVGTAVQDGAVNTGRKPHARRLSPCAVGSLGCAGLAALALIMFTLFEAPEVEAPEVKAPEVEAPEVKAPEVKAPEVEAREAARQPVPEAPVAPTARPDRARESPTPVMGPPSALDSLRISTGSAPAALSPVRLPVMKRGRRYLGTPLQFKKR